LRIPSGSRCQPARFAGARARRGADLPGGFLLAVAIRTGFLRAGFLRTGFLRADTFDFFLVLVLVLVLSALIRNLVVAGGGTLAQPPATR